MVGIKETLYFLWHLAFREKSESRAVANTVLKKEKMTCEKGSPDRLNPECGGCIVGAKLTRCSEGKESTLELQLELCLCVFMYEIILYCQTVSAETKYVAAVFFVLYLSCSIDQRQVLTISLNKIFFLFFFCLYAFQGKPYLSCTNKPTHTLHNQRLILAQPYVCLQLYTVHIQSDTTTTTDPPFEWVTNYLLIRMF